MSTVKPRLSGRVQVTVIGGSPPFLTISLRTGFLSRRLGLKNV